MLRKAGNVDVVGQSTSLTPVADDGINIALPIGRSMVAMVEDRRIAKQGAGRRIRKNVSEGAPGIPAFVDDLKTGGCAV